MIVTLRTLTVCLLFSTLASPGPGVPRADQAAGARPAVVAALLGEWSGSGVVNGRDSSITMTWDVTVSNAFVRLRFRNDMAPTDTQPSFVFEGHGYYRVSGTAGTGTWMDARGFILPVRVTLTNDAFVSDWGDESSPERGRTTYRLTGADAVEIVDEVRTADGTYREFGRSKYRRAGI